MFLSRLPESKFNIQTYTFLVTICISADWPTDLTKNVRQSGWPLVNRLKNVWPADYLMDRPTETRWLTNWLTKYHRKNLAENFLVLYLTDWLTTWHFWVTKKLTVSPRIKEYHNEKNFERWVVSLFMSQKRHEGKNCYREEQAKIF